MGKINNAPIGTYEHLFYDKNGNRKKPYNQKYSDEFIINCLKDFYLKRLSHIEISKKYNVSSGTVKTWIYCFKNNKNYRFYCEDGICDQLKGIINLKDYVCLDLDRPTIGKYTDKYKEIADMYIKGFYYKEICNKLNVSDWIIAWVVKRFNLPRRRPEYHTLDFMW